MNYRVGAFLLGAVALTWPMACGSSVDSSNPGGGGAGTGQAGGTNAGGTNAGGTNGGGSNAGGTSANGGGTNAGGTSANGGSNAGGAGGSGPMCPAAKPDQNAMCMDRGQECTYGTEQCTCFGGQGWNCTTCPAQKPANMSACMATMGGGFTACDYGSTQCRCEMDKWDCETCPANQPMDMSACTAPGLRCPYGQTTCQCRGGGMGNTEWACDAGNPMGCPGNAPMTGDRCMVQGQAPCLYMNESCTCDGTTHMFKCVLIP